MVRKSGIDRLSNPFTDKKQRKGFLQLASTDLSYSRWVSALGRPNANDFGVQKLRWSATWIVWSHEKPVAWNIDFLNDWEFGCFEGLAGELESAYRGMGYSEIAHPIFDAMRMASLRQQLSVKCGRCSHLQKTYSWIDSYSCDSCGATNRVQRVKSEKRIIEQSPPKLPPPPSPVVARTFSGKIKLGWMDEARSQCNDCGRVWFYTKADRMKEESKAGQNSGKSMMCCTGCAPAALIPNQQVVDVNRCPSCGSRSHTTTIQRIRG